MCLECAGVYRHFLFNAKPGNIFAYNPNMKTPTNLLRIALTSLLLFGGCVSRDTTIIYQKLIARVYTNTGITVQEGATFKQDDLFFTAMLPYKELACNYQWGSSAYAFQPGDGNMKLAEKAADIKIIALNDYNDTYKAGSNLADECTFYETQSPYDAQDVFSYPVESTARSKKAVIDAINQELSIYGQIIQRFAFRIKAKSHNNKPQRFAIVLVTDKYSALTDTTVRFSFKP